MIPEMEKRLNKLARFLGYGDPKTARVWFLTDTPPVEYQTPEEMDDATKLPRRHFVPRTLPPNHSVFFAERAMANVVLSLKGIDPSKIKGGAADYARNQMFAKGGTALLTSLCPLGRDWGGKREKWPERYVEWFGYKESQFRKWIEKDSDRFSMIREERGSHVNQLVICFPAKAHSLHRTCLNVLGNPSESDGDFSIYPSSRIIFAPGLVKFDGHIAKDKIVRLVKMVNDHWINPFANGTPGPDLNDEIANILSGDSHSHGY